MAERFLKTAGSPAAESVEDPGFYALGGKPEWVKVPDDVPGFGGQRVPVLVPVLRTAPCVCPVCERRARGAVEEREVAATFEGATRYFLAPVPVGRGGKVLGVIECPEHGFLWLAVEAP